MKTIQLLFSTLIFILISSCSFPQSREEQAVYFIYNLLSACNENNVEKFYEYFDEYTRNQDDTSKVERDMKIVYYLLTKFHNNKIDSLYWTTDNQINSGNAEEYKIVLFDGFDSLSGYKKAEIKFYFWSPVYGRIRALAYYYLDLEVDSYYRGELRRNNKLLDIDAMIETLNK